MYYRLKELNQPDQRYLNNANTQPLLTYRLGWGSVEVAWGWQGIKRPSGAPGPRAASEPQTDLVSPLLTHPCSALKQLSLPDLDGG